MAEEAAFRNEKQRKDKFDTLDATLLNYILFQIHLFLRFLLPEEASRRRMPAC